MQAIENSIRCLNSSLTNFEQLVCRSTAETYDIHGIHGLREFRSMDNTGVRAIDGSIQGIMDMQDKLERARVHLDLWKRRIHNLSSNLADLPTEIIQAILVAGMTPDGSGNSNYGGIAFRDDQRNCMSL